VVGREEICKRLWPDGTVVEFEHSVNTAVNRLREALGDSAASPRFIETLPRRGYRFVAPVEEIASADPAPVAAEAPAAAGPRPSRRAMAAVSVAVVAGGGMLWMFGARLAERSPQIQSLAVLPLINLSHDAEQEYFADGITEQLITELAQIEPLAVISRTSAMRYKRSGKSAPEIGRELNVDALVEGAVQKTGAKVRITAQLIHAASDRHLWSRSYEREMKDALALQAEVARAIAAEVRVNLTAQVEARLKRTPAVNPEAYEAYLKGRFQQFKLSRAGLERAESYYRFALQKDPAYAPAHAGIAATWLLRGDSGANSTGDALAYARAALAKARALDDSSPEIHMLMGNLKFMYEWDWGGAEAEFRQAIHLAPNKADARFAYADFLMAMQRPKEALAEMERALKLDPFNSFYQCFQGWHLVYAGRYDEAVARLEAVLEAEPEFSSAHMGLWGALSQKREYGGALAEAVRFFEVLGDSQTAQALKLGFAEGGYAAAMRCGAQTLEKRSKASYVPAIRIARLYAQAGEDTRSLGWLEKAYERRDSPLVHLAVARDWTACAVFPGSGICFGR
jgi:TolB-like protein/Tfp pilus assembly protein PilF